MKINLKKEFIPIGISIATVSDTRTKKTDKSGVILEKKILEGGHNLIDKKIITDEKKDIKNYFEACLDNKKVDVVITTGGSGLTDRDSTPDVLDEILEKEIPGFGEIFRMLSFKKINTSTIQSRAKAGISKGKFFFCLPGSPSACSDAWEYILKYQLDARHEPCNLIELMPRISRNDKK